MKFEFLIFVIFILLFYLFKKNKFKGGEVISQDAIDEVYSQFTKPYENALSLYNGLLDKYYHKKNPEECKKYFNKNNGGYPDLEESLDSIRNNINDMKSQYDNIFKDYIKLYKKRKVSTIDLTTCSHKISTVYIYSPNIGLYLHNNSTQDGKDYDGFSYGSDDDKIAWTLEYCGQTINNNTVVHIKSTYYNEYWMSDSLKGEGFKWSENRDINKAWNLIKIQDNHFKLQSIYLKDLGVEQCCLANDIIEGDKFKWEKQNEQNISWKIKIIQLFQSTSDTAIVTTRQLESMGKKEIVTRTQLDSMSKKEVHIKNNTLGVYLHSNSQGNYGFSNGSKTRDANWYLEYSGQLTDQTLVHIQSKSENNKNKYWLSKFDKGFIWSTQKDPEKAWYLIKLDGNNNYAIKSNYNKGFIQSNKAGEGKPFDGTKRKDMSNFKIEFE